MTALATVAAGLACVAPALVGVAVYVRSRRAAARRSLERAAWAGDGVDPVVAVLSGTRLATVRCPRCEQLVYADVDGGPLAHLSCKEGR